MFGKKNDRHFFVYVNYWSGLQRQMGEYIKKYSA